MVSDQILCVISAVNLLVYLLCDVWNIVGFCSRSQLVMIDTDVTQITANKGIKGENKVHPQASND